MFLRFCVLFLSATGGAVLFGRHLPAGLESLLRQDSVCRDMFQQSCCGKKTFAQTPGHCFYNFGAPLKFKCAPNQPWQILKFRNQYAKQQIVLSSYICLEISLNIKLYLKKFFQKNLRGSACSPIFKVKKFLDFEDSFAQKKSARKSGRLFFIVKITGYCADVSSTTAMCRSLSCFSVTGQGD